MQNVRIFFNGPNTNEFSEPLSGLKYLASAQLCDATIWTQDID